MRLHSSSTYESTVLELVRTRGLLRARDVTALGVPSVVLTRLVQAGKLARTSRGVYSMPGHSIGTHHSLAQVALRVPRGVVCLLSALRVHEIGTQAPFEVWLALPKGATTPKLEQPRLRIVRLTGAAFTDGIEYIVVDGVRVPVFSTVKTIADCFKFRNKIGIDVALEALREGWAERKITMDALWHFATVNRVANVMRPYLEALTA